LILKDIITLEKLVCYAYLFTVSVWTGKGTGMTTSAVAVKPATVGLFVMMGVMASTFGLTVGMINAFVQMGMQ
jgi:hypothetical protein